MNYTRRPKRHDKLGRALTVSPDGSAKYKSAGEAISAAMPGDHSIGNYFTCTKDEKKTTAAAVVFCSIVYG